MLLNLGQLGDEVRCLIRRSSVRAHRTTTPHDVLVARHRAGLGAIRQRHNGLTVHGRGTDIGPQTNVRRFAKFFHLGSIR